MHRCRVTIMVLIAVLVGVAEVALALQCGGRIASTGDSKWEVQEACGEPAYIEESIEVIPKVIYDEFRHRYVQIPVYVSKSVWTYNFGPTRLIYFLTFRENTLVKIETGGYGR
jgi:hypothetical protein